MVNLEKKNNNGQSLENTVQQMLEVQRNEGKIVDYVKHNPEAIFVVAKINPAMATKLKNSRIIGMPDFEIYLPKGRCFFIECKFGEGKETEVQKKRFKYFEENGFKVFICKNITDINDIISYINS